MMSVIIFIIRMERLTFVPDSRRDQSKPKAKDIKKDLDGRFFVLNRRECGRERANLALDRRLCVTNGRVLVELELHIRSQHRALFRIAQRRTLHCARW